MAKTFGIVPKHVLEIPLDELSPEEFLILALEAAQACNWHILAISREGFRAATQASVMSSGEAVLVKIHGNAADFTSESLGRKLVNTGSNKKNAEKFLGFFNRFKDSWNKVTLHLKFEAWAPRFSDVDLTVWPGPSQKPTAFDILRTLIPVEGYFMTPVLLGINTFILILMCFDGANVLWPDPEIVLSWGGNAKSFTLQGEWWRLITCNFLHFGVVHLLFNMSALVYIGKILEPLLGKFKFSLAYLLTGLTSSLCSLWWHDNSVSAGASGAIFGMYGVFFALLTTNLIEKEHRMTALKSIGLFVVYNLAFGAALGADNAGHIGGLLGGLFLGYGFYFILARPNNRIQNSVLLTISSALIVALSVGVYRTLPNDLALYMETMEEFSRNEKKALANYVFKSDSQSIQKLQTGVGLWERNITLLKEAEQLTLPPHLKARITLVKAYCEARIKIYELTLNDLRHGNFDGADYDRYNEETKRLIGEIKALDKTE